MNNGPIRTGFTWAAEIEFEGESFPESATFRSQFRHTYDGPVLADTASPSGIERINATTLRIRLTAAQTTALPPKAILFDVVRTDTSEYLRAEFEVMVKPTLTRM